jgi:hypothetical protein
MRTTLLLFLAFIAIETTAQQLVLPRDPEYHIQNTVREVRALYRVPSADCKFIATNDFEYTSELFKANIQCGEFECPVLGLYLYGVVYSNMAWDYSTQSIYYQMDFGSLYDENNNRIGAEYSVSMVIRYNEHYIRVTHGNNVLMQTGNHFLQYIYPKELCTIRL